VKTSRSSKISVLILADLSQRLCNCCCSQILMQKLYTSRAKLFVMLHPFLKAFVTIQSANQFTAVQTVCIRHFE